MANPSSVERASCSRAADEWRRARAEPRDRPRSPIRCATAPGSGPHRAALARAISREPPCTAAAGESKTVDTSDFVLTVDDDPDLLEVTSFVIEQEGMAVETARNGEEALALLRAGRQPSLVLLDLMMPVMNGWEFLTEIAKDPVLRQIPIVVLTAAKHVQVTGAAEVLAKPMDLTALLRVVERYVRGGRNAGS